MSRLQGMSLREKCAQMVFARFRFDAPDYERTVAWIRKDGIGGVCLVGGSRFDVGPFVNSLQRVSRRPVLVVNLDAAVYFRSLMIPSNRGSS